jgi:ABC-type phosphate transport system substrate-binding protein
VPYGHRCGFQLIVCFGCTGYQFRADNVILQYSPATTVSAAAKLASGEAAFVGLDGRIAKDQLAVFPADTVEVPVAGGALVVVYNLPGNPSLVLSTPLAGLGCSVARWIGWLTRLPGA